MNGFPNYGSYFNPFASPQYMNNTIELGEVIDMIKDISKAMYYCSIVEEKEEPKDKEKHMDGKMITTDVVK